VRSGLVKLNSVLDARGRLTSVDDTDLPFAIRRVFFLSDVTADRGGHAHIETNQLFLALKGSLTVTLRTISRTEHYTLDKPTEGLLIPRLTYTELTNFASDSVCIILADTLYDILKSLRSWQEYKDYMLNQ